MLVLLGVVLSALLLTATPAGAQRCLSSDECDDGLFCNGAEECVGGRRGISVLGITVFAEPGRCRRAKRGPCVVKGVRSRCDDGARQCVRVCDDADGDGHSAAACGGNDCDDADPGRYPGAVEVCDPAGKDEDCDPGTFGARDLDRDGAPDGSCCNGDRCGTDCDDTRSGVHPIAPEVCDELDNDCDGAVDEGVATPFYRDDDLHGFGAVGSSAVLRCAPVPGLSYLANDCDDGNPAIHPGAMVCGAQGSVQLCSSSGTFEPASGGQGPCLPQPNGTGVCP